MENNITLMEPKPFYRSKTLWFNALTILVAVATYLGYEPNPELARQITELLVAVNTVGNILLRLITSQPVR